MIDLDYHRFILQLVWVGGDLLQSIAKLTLRTVNEPFSWKMVKKLHHDGN